MEKWFDDKYRKHVNIDYPLEEDYVIPMKENTEKSKKTKKIIFFIIMVLVAALMTKLFYELSIFLSILIGIAIAVIIFLIDKYRPKEKQHYAKEDFDKLSSKEIREKIEQNKEFNKSGRKVLDIRKDYTAKEIISECFSDILWFSMPILFFGLILMGALGNIADIPKEDFMINSTRNLMTVANATLNAFFDIGYESSKPYNYLFLFYLAVFMAFFYPVIVLIYRFVRRYMKNGKDNNQERS
jgi:hypothetical protein